MIFLIPDCKNIYSHLAVALQHRKIGYGSISKLAKTFTLFSSPLLRNAANLATVRHNPNKYSFCS